jgi:periplasmic protein CpxP/Spy
MESKAPGISWAEKSRADRIIRNRSDPVFCDSTKRNPARKKGKMTPEEINNIAAELRRLGGELNLSDSQKEQLKIFLTDKYEKLQEYKRQNPNLSREDITQYIAKNRAAGREKIEKFLTRDQLKTWDEEVAKAKDFLSQRAASA